MPQVIYVYDNHICRYVFMCAGTMGGRHLIQLWL